MKTFSSAGTMVITLLIWVSLIVTGCSHASSERIPIVLPTKAGQIERLAGKELSNFLSRMYPKKSFTISEKLPSKGCAILLGTLENTQELRAFVKKDEIKEPDSFIVKAVQHKQGNIGIIAGANPRAVLYGVYAILEEMGCGFYLSYNYVPAFYDSKFTFDSWNIADASLVGERIIFNWHNFLSSCSTWNLAEWQHWIRQTARMRYTGIMVHAYGNNPMVCFTHNGQTKPVGYIATTARGRDWGTQHVNDVRRLHGAQGLFDSPVFGSKIAMVPDKERVTASKNLMRQVFTYAKNYGLDVVFALDVDTASSNPPNIINTLPASARLTSLGHPLANPDTPEGFAYYKSQIKSLLSDYPQIDRMVVWFRVRNQKIPWRDLMVDDFPQSWKTEYQAKLSKSGYLAKLVDSPSMFAISKIVCAFNKALYELGRKDVKLDIGTWLFDHMTAADVFMPQEIGFMALDYNIEFDRPKIRKLIQDISSNRPVIPILWAHHDMGKFIGRPYKPFANFARLLRESDSAGFGIIHWTRRPLDLYFKNLSQQVWKNTCNQSIEQTCREMAARTFGPQLRNSMGRYLAEWITDAPQFGGETRDLFIHRPLPNPEETIAQCRKRLDSLENIDISSPNTTAAKHLEYFKLLERFFIEFYQNEIMLRKSIALFKDGDPQGARTAIQQCSPESAIKLYAQAANTYDINSGEKAIIISMNLRWLPYFEAQRQAVGRSPARINFEPTQHEPLAQGAGTRTFYVDRQQHLWLGLGEKETQVPAHTLTAQTQKPPMTSEEEICKTYIETDKPILLQLKTMTARNLTAGMYKVHLLLPASIVNNVGQRVFDLTLRGSKKAKAVNDRIDLFKRAITADKVIQLNYSLWIDQGHLEIELTPTHGPAVLCGATLECTELNESQRTPEWLTELPEQLQQWLKTVQYEPTKPNEPWGLFTFSANSKIPYSIVSTAIAWSDADYFSGIEKMPGYQPKAREQMAAFVQQFQDPNTGQFCDPWLESCYPDRDDPQKLHILREAITKYTMGLLSRCGAKPKYPYMAGGHKEGKFDPDKYIGNIKKGDWNQPWGIGSHTGFQTVQLFQLVEDGHSEYIPVLREGVQLILSHQNPMTGMWGPESIPLSQQIGGTLKVIGRFQWSMGLIVPHMDKLADSIIKHHRSGAFYAGGRCASVPRNVAEMAYACMEASDYRRDELRDVLIELLDILRNTYQQSDGSFCYMADGRAFKSWCGAIVADSSEKSYGDVHGAQNVIYAMSKIYQWLGWTGMPWKTEPYWRDRIKKLKHKVFVDKQGKVRIEPRKDI